MKKETLSDKRSVCYCDNPNAFYPEEDVKEKIQNTQKRLKEQMDYEKDFCDKANVLPSIHPRRVKEWIDKIFKEEFGEELI